MKKGLTMTLLTVAFAMMGFQAMAMAPVISDISSPIVGNAGDITAPNTFVYSDAIDLTKVVTDDTSAATKILWSYEQVGTKYILNGIDPVNTTDGSTIEYNPGAKNIAANVGNSEFNPDGKAYTVTIRNKDLSPFGGSTTTPSTTGIVPAETGTITLTASDGSSYSQKDLVIYTDNGGEDRMSGSRPDWTMASDYFVSVPQAGTVTFSQANGGFCMETTPMGDNMAMWVGKAGDVPIAANSVYDIELQTTSSNQAPGSTPFWDMMLDNNNNDGDGLNLYGADCYFLSNEGGANSAVAAGKTFHIVWAPLAVNTPQWNDSATGPFRAAVGDQIKGRFNFRVMDIWLNGGSGIRADIQSGSICVRSMTMTKYPIEGVKVVGSALYNQSTFTYADPNATAPTGNFTTTTLTPGATTVSTTGGGITITPTTAGRTTMYTSFFPGDTNVDLGNATTLEDNFPVVNEAGVIFRMSYTIQATSASGAANPPDCMYINADTPSNEVIYQTFVTSQLGGCAMPKEAASTYVSFYHTNYATNSTAAGWKRMRPSFIVVNLDALGARTNDNSGAIKISNIKVEKVTLK